MTRWSRKLLIVDDDGGTGRPVSLSLCRDTGRNSLGSFRSSRHKPAAGLLYGLVEPDTPRSQGTAAGILRSR